MKLGVARRLMRLPGWVWHGLPCRLQGWAVHQHLLTFESYRRSTENGVGLRPRRSLHDRVCPCEES